MPLQTYTTLDEPLASAGTFANGINGLGQIVGSFSTASSHGFLYSGGTFTTVDDPPANPDTFAQGINAMGQIVGQYETTNGTGFTGHGFLYSGGVFITLDAPSAIGTGAAGINGSGQIVGSYVDASLKEHGFLYNPNSGTPYTTLDDPS